MAIDHRIVEVLEPTKKRPSASTAALAQLRHHVGVDLPTDYLEFLNWHDGATGDIRPNLPLLADRGIRGYAELWSIQEVLATAESQRDPMRTWRVALPDHLAIGIVPSFVAFIKISARSAGTLPYAIGEYVRDSPQITFLVQLTTFTELVDVFSTSCLTLRGANLRGADLRKVCLLGAQLEGADLTGADLTGADLRYASVEGADFRNAKLDGIQLTRAFYEPHTYWPDGFDPEEHGAELPWALYEGRWPESYERFYRSLGRT